MQIPGPLGGESDVRVAADGVCGSRGSRAQLVDIAVRHGMTAEQGRVLVESSVRNVCPGKVFAPDGPASFGDGVFLVGSEIEPGRWRTAGAAGRNCYWARLRGTSGELRDVIANGNGRGPVTVTISPSDVAFKTSGCAGWTKTG